MRTVNDPYVGGAEITPSDTDDIRPTRGIMIGVTGDLKVDMANSSTITITGLNAGVIYPLSVKRVYDTDTTATGIVAFY